MGKLDEINHPTHYNKGRIETIEKIFDSGNGEGFCLGCVQKYIDRAPHKRKKLKDLRKAQWYLNYLITHLETANERN